MLLNVANEKNDYKMGFVERTPVILDDTETGTRRISSKIVILQVGLLIGGRDPQVESRKGSIRCLVWPALSSKKVLLCGH
jgi:hypothetical protein